MGDFDKEVGESKGAASSIAIFCEALGIITLLLIFLYPSSLSFLMRCQDPVCLKKGQIYC